MKRGLSFVAVVLAGFGGLTSARAQRGTPTNTVTKPAVTRPPLPSRPNIVFIMTDDHASHAISAYGSKINITPNIDRLAREGMRFDRCFVENSICTPSRAAILTVRTP